MKNILKPAIFFISILLILFLWSFFWKWNYFLISLFFWVLFLLFSLFLNKKNISIILIFIFFWSLISATRLHFTFQKKPQSHISNFVNLENNITIIWKICDEIDKRVFSTKYTICTKKIIFPKKNNQNNTEKKGENSEKNNQKNQNIDKKNNVKKWVFEIKTHWKILINNSRYPIFKYWDFIKITWKLETPKDNIDFSYKNYLSRYEIYWIVQRWKMIKIEFFTEKSSILDLFYWKIFWIKNTFLEKIWEIYPEPHWSFLSGLLVWTRKWLPKEIQNDFRKNWLAHIVAISGYNITLIIILISWIFTFLPKNISFFITSTFIILFTIFVWASSAVVRAGIMWILTLFALKLWRPNVVFITALLTASVISLYNPKILWWDLWFQLSFLALIWVIYISPFFENISKKIPETLALKEAFILTISATITTFPLLSYHFWFISLISPIANLFVAPLIPLSMFFWFLSIISPFIFLEKIFGFLTYLFLDLSLSFSHFFANLKYSTLDIKIWKISVFIYFLLLLFFILTSKFYFKVQKEKLKKIFTK